LSLCFLHRPIRKTTFLPLTGFLFLLLDALDSWIESKIKVRHERLTRKKKVTQGSYQRDRVVWRYLPFFFERALTYFSSWCIVCHRGCEGQTIRREIKKHAHLSLPYSN
jgi:hypothetical protein